MHFIKSTIPKYTHEDETSRSGKCFPYFAGSAENPISSLEEVEYSPSSIEQQNCRHSLGIRKSMLDLLTLFDHCAICSCCI